MSRVASYTRPPFNKEHPVVSDFLLGISNELVSVIDTIEGVRQVSLIFW